MAESGAALICIYCARFLIVAFQSFIQLYTQQNPNFRCPDAGARNGKKKRGFRVCLDNIQATIHLDRNMKYIMYTKMSSKTELNCFLLRCLADTFKQRKFSHSWNARM